MVSGQGWTKNEGSRPPAYNVDVVYKNGSSKLGVSAKSLNCDKTINNQFQSIEFTTQHLKVKIYAEQNY